MPAFRTRRLARSLALASMLGAAALSAGCYYEGGALRSNDRFTYASTTWQPKTVTLVDTRTGETLWSVDIPVGRQLVIDFNAERRADNTQWLPDEALWDIMPDTRRHGALKNKMRVPPRTARRLDVTLRPVPEMPAGAPTASTSTRIDG
jgi:hypothetical protein